MSIVLARPLLDEASEHSYAWAEDCIAAAADAGIPLKDLAKGDATLDKLKAALKEGKAVALLFYDHGSSRRFVSQDGGSLVDYVGAKLLKGRLVYSMCCLSGSALGPRIIDAGGLAFFGYKEEFGFYIGSAEPAFREPANQGWLRLTEGQPVKEALQSMTEKFDEWVDYYTRGEGRSNPDAPIIASWLIHDRDCLVALGDMDLRLRDIPAPPDPEATTPWEMLIGFIWSILDAFGL